MCSLYSRFFISKSVFALVLFLMFSVILNAGVVEKTFYFEKPEITSRDGYDFIKLNDCYFTSIPGEPQIPLKSVSLLLAPGEQAISATIKNGELLEIPGDYFVFPAQYPVPISETQYSEFIQPSREIYHSDEIYPQKLNSDVYTQYSNGHSIAFLQIYPVQYQPLAGKLSYYSSMTIIVETRATNESKRAYRNFYRGKNNYSESLQKSIDNQEMFEQYSAYINPSDNTNDNNNGYLIITNNASVTYFQNFIFFKRKQGYNVIVKTTESIYLEFAGGHDNPDRIRSCIIDAYTNDNVSYVLLGGDVEIIPHRGLYGIVNSNIGIMEDFDIPADIYYGCLDRVGTGNGPDWNVDSDDKWGEHGEADYLPEVSIGRISAETQTEFTDALYKQMLYQNNPVRNDLEKALMVGEQLDDEPTWGGDYKDEIIFGDNNGTAQCPPIPNNFTVNTIYERENAWTFNELKDSLNAGTHIVNNMAHANSGTVMKISRNQVNTTNFTVNGVNHNYYIMYSQGCYAAAFDNRNSSFAYQNEDCIVEIIANCENGCVSFIGNSRYGWYSIGSTGGASQFFDKRFFAQLWEMNVPNIGRALDASKMDLVSLCNEDIIRWVYYELTLFGDPSLFIWREYPTDFSYINILSDIVIGTTQITVQVYPFEDYTTIGICTNNSDNINCRGFVDDNGVAVIDLNNPITLEEVIYVTANSPNIVPKQKMVGWVPTIWEGQYSNSWGYFGNWQDGVVPSVTDDVLIPSGTPNSPVISTNDAYCRNLTIESGASLTIGPRTLTVDGNADIYGHLVMNNNDSKLIVNGSLNWRDGSSADISNTAHTAQIDVYRHMNFSAGANVILDRGSVYFKGNQFSTIETLNSACSFNNLYLSKESSTVYLGTEYSVDLTITGELYNSYDCTARTLYDNNNINIYVDLFPSIIFHMEAGKINFLGNDQRIVVTNSSTDSINFNDVELNGSLTLDQFISTGGEININGDLIFNTGTLDAADIDIYLSGNWINNTGSSAFTPGTGSVIFNGTGDQTCNGGSFNILKLNKPSGQLIMSGSRTIQSYDWMDGIITFQSGYNQILDLTDNGFYGTWQVNGATLNIFQNAAQSVDLKGSMIIYSGAVNVFGGSGDSRWPGSASAYFYMAGGTLDFVDQGIFINTDYAFPHLISSGTIKTPYDFAVTRHDFTPTGGTIELYGNQAAEINLGSSSNLVNLKINKSSSSSDEIISRNEPTDPLRKTAVTVLTDMDLAGSLLISGGVFNLNGHELDVAQNVEISGKLKMTNTADKLNVDGDVIWNSGSADEITTGEITLEGDWKFMEGTTATLGSGNTVRFVGSEVSEIVITEFTNAEFGDLIIDKTDNYIIIDISCSAPMKLAGNLTINEDNEFYVAYMEVDGDITLAAGSLLKIEFGQNEVEGNISVSGHLIVDDCNFFCSQAIAVNSGGSLTIDNDGDFVNDKPYTGNYLTFAGTLNILDGRFAVWDENVRFTSTPNFGENGVLELGRGLQANTANAFQPSNGALYFMGGSLSILDISNGNYLHRLIINKVPTQSCCLNADLTVNENLSLSSGYLKGMGNELTVNNDLMIGYNGVLDPDDEVVKVGGFWYNNRGAAGFVEGEGTVRLIGNSTGGIASDETFYNLYIDKDYGSYWYTEIAADKTVQVENEFKIINGKLSPKANSALNVDGLLYLADGTGIRVFDGDDGVNLFVGGHWSDNNDDNAEVCGFHPGSSTVTFDGSTDQVFTSSYSQPEFYNLTINKNDCHFIPYNNLIIGGDLLITDGFWSDYASNMSHTFLGSVDICENGWSARYSTVTFGGTEEAAFQEAGLCKFYNIIIDKNPSDAGRTAGELTLLSNIRTIWEGDLTIQSGTLNANGYEIGCTGNVTIDGGKLLLNDNSILKVGENKILSVNGSGRLESIGSAGSEATITNYVYNGYHDVYIYTGTIAAEHTIFKRMTTDGVYISLWGNVDTDHSFHNCTFQDGVSGGRLLRIKNDQDLVVNDAVFPTNSWGSSYNVYKNINQGSVEFINASGDFAGESHDYDPYNRLDWTIIIPPEIYVYPSEINYGNVYIGQSQIDGFHIQNTGGLPLSGTITAPEGYTVAYFSGDENEIRETRNTIDFMVEGGNDKAYSVLFEPLLEQSYNGNIVITHNAGGDDEIVQVTGAGIPVPPPEVTASPDSLHFGNVNLGNDKTIGFTIMNTGGSDLIGTVSTPNGFSIAETSWRNIETGERKPANLNHETGRNALSFDIEPYWQVDYDVAFEPTAMQEFFDYMIISSNAGQDVLIPCVGNGVDAVFNFSPHVINKTLQSGETDTENLNLSNAGNVPIDYLAYIEYENNVTTILSESFEGSTFPPAGWSLQSLDGWGNWEHCGYSGYAGTHSALASTMMVDDARLIAPAFTATADCIFRYWVRAEDPLMFFENALFEVEITTNGSDWITLQSYSQEIFTADWVPKGLALGAYAGQSVQLAFRVQDNSFGSGINVDDVQITGSASPAYSWLSLNGGNNITGTLAVGSPAVDKVIGFNTAGLADGSYYANIRFISNDATDPIDDVALVLNVGVYELTLTPSALDFGAVAVGDSATIQFTIENTGTLESYGEINPPAGYEVAEFWPERSSPHPESGNREQLYYMLFPNSSFTYEVTFKPVATGDHSGNITITNNLGEVDELLPVSGVGLAAELSTQPADFYQELPPEQTALQQLSIANLGNDDLTYSISISHSADGRDALVSTGFEDTTFPPAGWTEEIISGSVDWNQNSTYPHSGSYCAMADHLITDARLISTAFSAASDTELSYYVRTDDFPMYGGDFGVEVSTDGVNWSYLDQYANASLSATYVQKVVSLSAYAGSAVQIAFRMHQITGTADAVYLDDVQIGSPPPPTDQWLSLDGTATASGTITVGSAADIIEVGFDAAGLTAGSYNADIIIDSNDPFMSQIAIPTMLVVGYPQIVVSPDSIGYGTIQCGESVTNYFRIENTGTITLNGSITAPDGYSVAENTNPDKGRERISGRNSLSYEIAAGISTNFTLTFSPSLPGEYYDDMTVSHNSGGSDVEIIVAGIGATAPTVTTADITYFTDVMAIGGGNVTDDGYSDVTAFGVCWSTSSAPTLADDFTTDGTGIGEFSSVLTGLTTSTQYHVRAYAQNFYGLVYGSEITFTTTSGLPPVPPENLTIEISGGYTVLNWDSVDEAISYRIYSSSDPDTATENWTFEAEVSSTTWSEPITAEKKFYYVTALNLP